MWCLDGLLLVVRLYHTYKSVKSYCERPVIVKLSYTSTKT